MLYEMVYASLKDYIQNHSKVSTTVLKRPNGTKYPMVTIQEISNITISNANKMESYSNVGFEINIFANSTEIDGEYQDSMDVARYIQMIVSEYMDYEVGFKRIMCEPTPIVNNDKLYRVTMRYTGNASDYRGRFFKW